MPQSALNEHQLVNDAKTEIRSIQQAAKSAPAIFSMPGVKYERDSVDKAECTFQGDGQTAAFLSHRSVELSIRQQVSSDLAFRKFFEILFTALHQAS